MAETFLDPQPFNVEIGPEVDIAPPVRMPVIAAAVPIVDQVITELYRRDPRGVRGQGPMRARRN
jgi:hypothetical protein